MKQILKFIINLFKGKKQQYNLSIISNSKLNYITQIDIHIKNNDIKFIKTPLFNLSILIINCDLARKGTSDYFVIYYY